MLVRLGVGVKVCSHEHRESRCMSKPLTADVAGVVHAAQHALVSF